MSWGAPQWIMIAWLGWVCVMGVLLDGRARRGHYSGMLFGLGAVAEAAVLWWGGFFG